jgi:hypothetical protein
MKQLPLSAIGYRLSALGEAIIDAVATRFPAAFEFPLLDLANDESHAERL